MVSLDDSATLGFVANMPTKLILLRTYWFISLGVLIVIYVHGAILGPTEKHGL